MLYRTVTKQILLDLDFFPVISIIGPRQVGKTTLAKYIQQELSIETLYLDLELDSDYRRLANAEAFLKLHQDKCIIIDEAQRMPTLLPLLRALVDLDRRPARFILLGSASPELIHLSSETLAGRIAYTELTPFSWIEVSKKYTLAQHWLNGGFPQALLAPTYSQTKRWISNFISTFLYKSLNELGTQITSQLIEKLLIILSAIHGNLLNMSDLSRSLGIAQPTVKRYLDILEGSFMIRRLEPFFINVSKRLVKSPKIYIRDSGILHYLTQIVNYNNLLGHPIVGASWEGYVIEQIRRVVGTEWRFYFYRTHKGAEIDLFLINPSGRKFCIEIKFSTNPTVSRGFFEAIQDLQPDHCIIIVPEADPYPTTSGAWVYGLNNFLCDKLLIDP